MTQLTSIDDLLEQMVALGASDLHVTVGSPPAYRVRGHIVRAEGFEPFAADDTRALLYRILSSEQQKHFELNRQLDFAYSMPGVARFRVNVYYQRESVGAAFRLIPQEIKTLEELSLPPVLHTLAEHPRGLVLVTGPTGSGKSTTLAAVIDEINRTRTDHILTVEDPIEFVHRHKRCIVNQREIGPDASSFSEALKAALRQDPDVILVGEMRDLETISTALTAAETGHIVFGTLHTSSAAGTINRIIDVFPTNQQEQIRTQLASAIIGILCQQLLKKVGGGRVAAFETLVVTPGIANLIRENKIFRITSSIQTGARHGMMLLDDYIFNLWRQGLIIKEDGLAKCNQPEELERRFAAAERGVFDEEPDEGNAA